MKLTLRFFTIVCYFLPFTFFLATCNSGFELRFVYNQAEADKNILFEKESPTVVSETAENARQVSIDTSSVNMTNQNTLGDTTKASSDTLQQSKDYSNKILRKIIMPTDTSLSGIGSVLYFKNLTGQIAIAISLLISLVLLVAFIKSQKTKLRLLLIAVLCLTIFIIDSFISNVTLLWGCWASLTLLLFQVILEFNHKTNAQR